jgi:hypothetical protein
LLSDGRAFVLVDDGVVGRFGAGLAWAVRAGASSLDVLVDGSDGSGGLAAGVVARRAAGFSLDVAVWAVDGRSLTAAAPAGVVEVSAEGPPEDLVALLESHGLEVVWEHGVLRGEVLGLEVARTVAGSLEVGVGRHDRMARFEMRPSEPLSSALAEAASAVRSLRRPGAPVHPANRLARSRWLRSLVVSTPGAIGLASGSLGVVPVAPPLPWFDLPEAGAAPCVGVSASSGAPVVAVCSVGVDVDLVPTAADCRLAYGDGGAGGAELWLVVPAGDDLPITHELAGLLSPAARVVTVPSDWPSALAPSQP